MRIENFKKAKDVLAEFLSQQSKLISSDSVDKLKRLPSLTQGTLFLDITSHNTWRNLKTSNIPLRISKESRVEPEDPVTMIPNVPINPLIMFVIHLRLKGKD